MGDLLGWKEVSIGEVTDNFDSKRIPVRSRDRTPGPYPYYGASGIVDWVDAFIFDGLYLLVAEDGENVRSRNTKLAFLADGKFWVNNHAHIIRGNDRADTRFLSYAVEATDVSGYITGSAQPKLSQSSMNAVRLLLPPLPEQRAIASVLGALDDKIEQNRRAAGKLEALARAVFRAWFVDFAPVHAKADGATTYPGLPQPAFDVLPSTFQDSPLGPIPEGWEVAKLRDVLNLHYGKSLTKKNRKPGVVPVYGSGGVNGEHDEALVDGPGIIVGRKGSVGTLYWEDADFFPIDTTFYVEPTAKLGLHSLFELLKTFGMETMNTDAAVPGLNRDNAYRLEFAGPPPEIADAFEMFSKSLRDAISQAKAESQKLAELRDYLLPRLLSGSIRVRAGE